MVSCDNSFAETCTFNPACDGTKVHQLKCNLFLRNTICRSVPDFPIRFPVRSRVTEPRPSFRFASNLSEGKEGLAGSLAGHDNRLMATFMIIIGLLANAAIFAQTSAGVSAPKVREKDLGLLAKPARVPFSDTWGTLLVHLPVPREEGVYVDIRDEYGAILQKTRAVERHTDRYGYQWLHVLLDLTPLPYGASRVWVTVWRDEGESDSVSVKVVRAPPSGRGAVMVDNVRGCLVGSDGLPFFAFGAYTYGVTTEIERGVPEAEVQFGELTVNVTILIL